MANTIGTAYIQIEPSADGISGKIEDQLNGELSGAGEKGGHSFAKGFGSVIGGVGKVAAGAAVAAGTAITKITKDAVNSFSEYEQLKGGAELLFGDAYDKVADNAASAFSRVQMSQNEYLQQVNGFATGLKEALGGDENAAADLADRIVTAEADIVAATGNTAENVQNAFNGIMKNNFTMLDNLQIGIKPTKEGMQEVIDKMNELNGTEYEMNNLADMQAAIVDYVKYVGMAEYAQNEASDTIQGSLATMGAAWSNLLTGMATDGADINGLVDNLVSSVSAFAENIIPVIGRAIGGVSTMISKLAPIIARELPKLIADNLPTLLSAVISTAQALLDGLLAVLPSILQSLISALPDVIDALIQLTMGVVQALPQIINELLVALPTIIPMLVEKLTSALPLLIQGLVTLVLGIVQAMPEIINALIVELPNIIGMIVDSWLTYLPMLIDGMTQLVIELATHLPEICMALIQAIPVILQRIGESIVAYGPTLLISIQNLWQTIWQYISGFGNRIHESVSNFFTTFKANFNTWLSQLPERIAYWIGAMVAKWISLMYELPFKIAQIYVQIITKLQEFGRNLVEKGREMVTEFKTRFIEGFNELPEKMLTVGHNIVDGLWNGIKNAWSNLTSWVGDLCSNLVKGFTDNLQIGSPSKVFRDEVGRWIPAGLAEGIESGIGTLNSSMEDMTMAVSPSNVAGMSAYTPSSGVANDSTSGQALYDLLSRYLPLLESQTNVNVSLEGDAQGLFNVVRNQNKIYRRMNGESAFA